MQIDMKGRCALITGGSRGMGLAIALKFAGAGADVAILARRADVLEESRSEIEAAGGGKAVANVCDVGDSAQLTDTFRAVSSDLGKVDILVNNAGSSVRGKLEDVTDEMWSSDLNLKLFGAIRLSRLAWPGMKERRWGRIVNVLNSAAKTPRPEGAPTAVTRAAGMALTKVMAGEGAPFGILVNALCTGRIATDQIARRHAREKPDMPIEEFIQDSGKDLPMGRMGTAEEFANMACFLASDAASYITGTAINVDGGLSPVV